jgi:hypothetical protein
MNAANSIGPQAEWLYQHGMLIGWPAICYVAWRTSQIVTTLTATMNKAVAQIDTMASANIPAMQTSLSKQDGHLESMDTSLKTLVDRVSLPAQFATAPKAAHRKR